MRDPAVDPGQIDEAPEAVCLCAFCRQMLWTGEPMADHHVYKRGELQYIELAHVDCARTKNEFGLDWYWDGHEA